jgi:hypothetical protein
MRETCWAKGRTIRYLRGGGGGGKYQKKIRAQKKSRKKYRAQQTYWKKNRARTRGDFGGWKKIRAQKNCPTPPQISNGPSLTALRGFEQNGNDFVNYVVVE